MEILDDLIKILILNTSKYYIDDLREQLYFRMKEKYPTLNFNLEEMK